MTEAIYAPSHYWTLNELRSMMLEGDLLPFGDGFVGWDFLDNADSRLLFLKLNYRHRGVPIGRTKIWVQEGGRFPEEVELEEPRRKRYC